MSGHGERGITVFVNQVSKVGDAALHDIGIVRTETAEHVFEVERNSVDSVLCPLCVVCVCVCCCLFKNTEKKKKNEKKDVRSRN